MLKARISMVHLDHRCSPPGQCADECGPTPTLLGSVEASRGGDQAFVSELERAVRSGPPGIR